MTGSAHHHGTQPRQIGYPGYPGYPGLPGAASICYAIADGCAACLDRAIDEAGSDVHVCSALIAYVADVLATAEAAAATVPAAGRHRSLPAGLGHEPVRAGAPVPGRAFVAAARAAFGACPASCAGNGVPAAREVLSSLTPEDRARALADAVGQLAVYQPRTERGRDALKALVIHV